MSRRMISATMFAVLMASSSNGGSLTGGDYAIVASTIDNGGGTATGGSCVLHGTAAQPEARAEAAKGGDFILSGGFWAGISDITELIFKDGFEDPPPNQVTINTTLGPVTGDPQAGVTRFLGIPYAAPPLAELRFRPPAPAQPWAAPRDATSFGPKCLQLLDADASGTEGSEDCLQLNVWTPQACEGADLPVLLFIHGGGNAIGSGIESIYEGSRLAEAGPAVVVTINYRLAALGWLALDELDGEDPSGASGNYGLRDQIAALEWVRANVARFGGDPNRITVFGESAGAVNTCALIGSPAAAGLFAGAIAQSGSCLQPSRAQIETLGTELVASAGCGGGDVPSCLRALPAEELIALSPTGYPAVSGLARGWGPHVDGVLLPQTTIDAMAAGEPGVPFAVGSNRDETAQDTPPNLDEATFTALVQATFLGLAPQVLAAYPLADYADPSAAWAALTGDFKFICNARRAAVASASGGAPTWRYQFSYDDYTTLPNTPKWAFHGLELVYLFGNFDTLFDGFTYMPNPGDLEISAALQGLWIGFAATGEFPDPSYVAGADPYLELDVPSGSGMGLRTAQCDFWDSLF